MSSSRPDSGRRVTTDVDEPPAWSIELTAMRSTPSCSSIDQLPATVHIPTYLADVPERSNP